MQIHELTEFQGMPGSGDFLAIDNGNRTQKIEAENLGVTTAMTTAEAEAGTSTDKRVMTPKMFHDYVEDNTAKGFVELTQAEYDALTQEEKNDGRVFFITDGTPTPSPYILACYPVGSYFETSDTNFDPNTEFGGTWESVHAGMPMILREVRYSSSVTINGGSYVVLNVDLNYSGYVPVAVDSLFSVGTLVFSLGAASIGSSGTAQVYVWNNYSDSRTASELVFRVLYRTNYSYFRWHRTA